MLCGVPRVGASGQASGDGSAGAGHGYRAMSNRWWIACLLAVASAGLTGCGDGGAVGTAPAEPTARRHPPEASPAPTTPPAQAAAQAALQPSTRPPVVLIVDEQPREFPPARLFVESRNGKTVALLMSEDPREAIDDDYTGNSFYLEVAFDEEVDSLRDRVWQFQATSPERSDGPHGLFLEGNRKQLQPFELKVHFEGPKEPGAEGVAWISGTFYQFEEAPPDGRAPPPRIVPVAGRIPLPLP